MVRKAGTKLFSVRVDGVEHLRLASSSCAALIDALFASPSARRVSAKPALFSLRCIAPSVEQIRSSPRGPESSGLG